MKHHPVWILSFVLTLLLAGCGIGSGAENGSGDVPAEGSRPIQIYENNVLSSGSGWFGDLPNGLRPMILVEGTLYRWAGLSQESLVIGSDVFLPGSSSTYLPKGYTAAGAISGLTEEVPETEFQLRAAFSATGTVYTSKASPEVIYVNMTTDWLENSFIRFVSDDLMDNECISYQGKHYLFRTNTDVSPRVEELPEGCVLIGTLTFIGRDLLPSGHLETNRQADGFGKLLDGREVYADPEDSSVLYVYEHYYWARGDHPAWRECRLLEE